MLNAISERLEPGAKRNAVEKGTDLECRSIISIMGRSKKDVIIYF